MIRRKHRATFYAIHSPEIMPLTQPGVQEQPKKDQNHVSFAKIPNARTGNILFQYLFAIRICLLYGHKYVAVEEFPIPMERTIKIKDDSLPMSNDDEMAKTSHIICEGFFQKSEYYVPIREQLLEYLASTEDYWFGVDGEKQYARDFLSSHHSVELQKNDIVVSLRLDDFIQLPRPKSDILPPRFYTDIIDKWFSSNNREDGRLVIVCDKLRHSWEHKYLEFFQKWSPVLVQGTLASDFALMRDCPALIHSNSTLCWMASFLSLKKTHRFIPMTGTYTSQQLDLIEESKDEIFHVSTLEHEQVYRINIMCDHRDLEPLPYSIPDEIIISSGENVEKPNVVSPLVPGDTTDYAFGLGQEADYYAMYKSSHFALTQKKGGWDCLRHYEILANGAIPIFEELDKCPIDTMTSFPKALLANASKELLPWYNTEDQQKKYEEYRVALLDHVRLHCSCSAVAKNMLSRFPSMPTKILMLTGHPGVNYTRELTWIGIKRAVDIAVEWPPIDYLYDSYSQDAPLYGNGFTYSRRLPESHRLVLTEPEVVQSIKEKQWDLIIYGKVGPDEGAEGSLPNLPLWEHVFKRYSRDEIAFLYGGDGMQDMTWGNRYSIHLVQHCSYARCFVRELIRWDGRF